MSIFSIASASVTSALRDGRLERVEVHDHEIDREQLVHLEVGAIAGVIAAREDAAVDARVQRLHAAAEHLGAAGERLDVLDLEPRVAQRLRGAARADQLDAELAQTARELDQPAFVRDGKQRAHDGSRRAHQGGSWTHLLARRQRREKAVWRGSRGGVPREDAGVKPSRISSRRTRAPTRTSSS